MDKETHKVIKEFAEKIKKLKPEKIILFGSRARGDNFKHSDFDVIIVSKSFAGKKITERMSELYAYWERSEDLEPLCYTPEEFEKYKRTLPIIKHAVKEGKVIAY
jgi:predicted nucleotidyltransferase